MKKILILEDDYQLAGSLKEAIEKHSYAVTFVTSVNQACALIEKTYYDIVICDRKIGKDDGLEFIEYLRDLGHDSKVLCISNAGEIEGKLESYDRGIDDYLTKPFSIKELVRKIFVLDSFSRKTQLKHISVGPITLAPKTGVVYTSYGETRLRKKEMQLCEQLARHRNYVVTRDQLINKIWPEVDKQPLESTVDVYIRRIRSKLGSDGKHLRTMRGFGYALVDEIED